MGSTLLKQLGHIFVDLLPVRLKLVWLWGKNKMLAAQLPQLAANVTMWWHGSQAHR